MPSLARSVPKPLKVPSLARSVPKPLKVPSLARFVHKPLKVPSLARSVLKPLKEPSFARSVPKPLSSRLCMVCIGRLTPSTSALVPQHIKVVIEESSLMYAGPSFTSLQYIEFILTNIV